MDESKVKQIEREISEAGRLWRTKPRLFWTLLVAGSLGLTCYVWYQFVFVGGLGKGLEEAQKENSRLQDELRDAKSDRDAKATQLAPFLAMANRQFQNSPEPERLTRLLKQIDDATIRMQQASDLLPRLRRLNGDAAARFVAAMQEAKGFEAVIRYESGHSQAAQLAEQLNDLFGRAGWRTSAPWFVVSSEQGQLPPLQVALKDMPPGAVQAGIAVLLDSLGLPRMISQDTNMPSKQLLIYIGPQ